MTVIYTSVNQRFNKILFRGYKDGKRIQSSDAKYAPVLYIPTDVKSTTKSLFKKDLQTKEFENVAAAKEYIKTYKDIFQIHGNDKFQYDFIHRNFTGELAVTLPQLKVCIIDIETTVGTGKSNFPDVMDPEETVTLITIKDLNSKKMITWGCQQSTVSNYELCSSESDLLNKFINHIVVSDPDIISGWNCIYFDIAYLGSRIKKILGDAALKRLSPFNLVETKTDILMGREQLRYDIVGRSVLDLLDLYKKFRFINRASYKLDYIGEVELKMKKLENPAASFKEFYTNHWDTFVEYNQRDVELVELLEAKLGMIYLAVTLAYLTKVNYDDVFSPVKTWESYILSTLYEENVFCELKRVTKSDTQIVGGYVKEPVPGMYDWTASWDAASLYPSIIMGWNMSPETIVDMIPDINPDDLLSTGKIPIDTNYTLAANGSRYKRETQGVLPRLTSTVFDARKLAKSKMLKLKQEYETTHDPALKLESDRYGVLQLALKVQANSLYGICCNEYFLFFDNRLAEGITTTGQYIIQDVGRGLNVFMNKLLKTSHDYVITSDTDSCYVHLGPIVDKYLSTISDDQRMTDALMKMIELKFAPELDSLTNNLSANFNTFKNTIFFKLEAISRRSVFLAKKRNFQKVLDNEGVRYAEPEYKVTGIETNRSSTPDIVRAWLMDAIKLILDNPNRDILLHYIDERRQKFNSFPLEQIAFPRGANNLQKYSDSTKIYTGGTPIAVRASLLFNHYIGQKNLKDKYELIKEGDKIKFIYLKEPNTIKEDIIAFSTILPPELGLAKYIDYDTQFEKVFLDPLKNIMIAIGWKMEDDNDLDAFF